MKRGDVFPMFDPKRGIRQFVFLERDGKEMLVQDVDEPGHVYRVDIPSRYVKVELSEALR